MKTEMTYTYYECDLCKTHVDSDWAPDWYHLPHPIYHHQTDNYPDMDLCERCYKTLNEIDKWGQFENFRTRLQYHLEKKK